MTLYSSAIIDNSSLINLSHLHKSKAFFHQLKNLFHTIYIPAEVKTEYAKGSSHEPHRQWILQRLNPVQGFYRLCSTYDSLIMDLIKNYRGIDKGEAETYAQLKKINASLIISDDYDFIKALKALDKHITVYSTLHIICWLEIIGPLKNWTQVVKEVYNVRPFSSADLRQAYVDITKKLGLSITKKIISSKCSLKKILQL